MEGIGVCGERVSRALELRRRKVLPTSRKERTNEAAKRSDGL